MFDPETGSAGASPSRERRSLPMQTRVAPQAVVVSRIAEVVDFQFDRLGAGREFDVDGDDANGLRAFVDAFPMRSHSNRTSLVR